MENPKRGFLPMRHRVKLSQKHSPKTNEELKRMSDIPYASAISSVAAEAHWIAVKTILKYLRRTKDVLLVYDGGELILEGFSDASFQSDDDDVKSQSEFVFKLNDGVVAWKSSKQDTTPNSTMETEYIAALEAAKERKQRNRDLITDPNIFLNDTIYSERWWEEVTFGWTESAQ
ncbi:hypothetical protein Sango_2807800 [Sesamum angolense]|uniref:Uncharacterized protein n=1 Tax=Sesamum angolense TaxID=2727404 RepID=A0AAE1T725_9LAMI|nr:hypothetical protein Sango_2807800 [Sesamum angolense]